MGADVIASDWLAPSVLEGGNGWRPFGEAGGAFVVQVDLAPHAAREADALGRLDEPERARLGRFLFDRPRRDYSLCRAALRDVLCRQLDCDNRDLAFDALNHGKPFALVRGMPVPMRFNLSHSGRYGLIALAPDGRVGVDVEERVARHDLDGEIRTVFAPGERAELASTSGERKLQLFFRLWTLKEALIKALGTGFSLDTALFEVPQSVFRGQRKCVFRFPQFPAVRWWLEDLGNARFAAAVAREMDPDPAPARAAAPA